MNINDCLRCIYKKSEENSVNYCEQALYWSNHVHWNMHPGHCFTSKTKSLGPSNFFFSVVRHKLSLLQTNKWQFRHHQTIHYITNTVWFSQTTYLIKDTENNQKVIFAFQPHCCLVDKFFLDGDFFLPLCLQPEKRSLKM